MEVYVVFSGSDFVGIYAKFEKAEAARKDCLMSGAMLATVRKEKIK